MESKRNEHHCSGFLNFLLPLALACWEVTLTRRGVLQMKSSNQANRLASRVKQLEDEKQRSEERSRRLQDQINVLQTQIEAIVNLN